MNVTRKTAGQPHQAGARVRIGSGAEVFTIAEVEFVERGSSRFDFYRLTDEAGVPVAGRYVRADLRPAK